MKNNIGLKDQYTDVMVNKLNAYLSNVQVMYMNVRGYHWNVVGKQFFALHKEYENVYNHLNEMADEIAERILMLGGSPVHSFTEYIQMAGIKERLNISNADDTIRAFLDDQPPHVFAETLLLMKNSRRPAIFDKDGHATFTITLITGQDYPCCSFFISRTCRGKNNV